MAGGTAQTVIKNPMWWHRCSAMERRLTLISTVAFSVSVALIVSLSMLTTRRQQLSGAAQTSTSQPATHSEQDVCLTPGCIQAASEALSKMDRSVEPCDDFYQYACGNYLRTTNIPDDQSRVSSYSALGDQLLEKLRNAVEEEQPEAAVPRSLRLARDLYNACTDRRLIETRRLTPLQKVLKKDLGGWPTVEGDSWDEESFDWLHSIERFLRAGFSVNYFIEFTVDTDLRNSSNHIIYLDQAQLGLSRELLVKGPSDKLVVAYYQYQVDVAAMLGADKARAERELRQSLEFEIALANISVPMEERREWTGMYVPHTVEQLQREFPSLPWRDYLRMLLPPDTTISDDEVVLVVVPSYFKSLEVLLTQTPKRVLANYATWRAVESSVRDVTLELRERRLQFDFAVTGKKEREFRWKYCLEVVTEKMPLSVSSIYVRRYVNEEAKRMALEMVADIRQEFLRSVQEMDWMDEGTRKKALEKVKAMHAYVAYPDELLDDTKLDKFYEKLYVNRTLYLESMLNVTRFLNKYSFSQLRQPVSKVKWINHSKTTNVNAFHDFLENSIDIPAGILQGVFFGADRPKYMNYGGIGFIIGQVFTRGFDDEGRRVDKDGSLADWWDPVTRDKFLKKAECLISQAGNFTDEQTGMHLNGINTQGQNTADNSGVKQAYRAYRTVELRAGQPEPRLPTLTELSPRQMFWVSYAQIWCSKYRTEKLRNLLTTDAHPPARFRVLGPVSNRPEFAEDFSCPLGSRMNPPEKCQVW